MTAMEVCCDRMTGTMEEVWLQSEADGYTRKASRSYASRSRMMVAIV